MSPNHLSLEFIKLQERYLVNLPDKLKKIDDSLNAQDVNSIAEHFHKLKGNGQIYGFKSISDIAVIVDQHYKSQSKDFIQWAAVGFSLLQTILPLLQSKSPISLESYSNYKLLLDSIKPFTKKGSL